MRRCNDLGKFINQKSALILILVFIMFSCTSIKSGKYIFVKNYTDFKQIAKNIDYSINELKSINPSYNSAHASWVFVPMKPGFLEKYDGIKFDGIDLLWPVPASNVISSEFGERWGKSHEGIDIPAKTGTVILAAEGGKVIFSGNSLKSYGKMIIIKHKEEFFTVYAHANRLHVSKGDTVSRGQVIANVGTTGRSTGPHLHFELRKNTKALNPKRYISKNL